MLCLQPSLSPPEEEVYIRRMGVFRGPGVSVIKEYQRRKWALRASHPGRSVGYARSSILWRSFHHCHRRQMQSALKIKQRKAQSLC